MCVPRSCYLPVPFQKTVFPGFIKGCHTNDWKISKMSGLTSPNCLRGHLFLPRLIFPGRGIWSLTWALTDSPVNTEKKLNTLSSVPLSKLTCPQGGYVCSGRVSLVPSIGCTHRVGESNYSRARVVSKLLRLKYKAMFPILSRMRWTL